MSYSRKSPSATIEASLLVAGDPLQFHVRHDGRPFAAGVPGAAYTVRVRNLMPSRVEVILTVDGRHVLRDEPGDAHACQGLVIPANGWHEFPGWQFGDSAAGQFLFSDPSASVAAMTTGSAVNAGVIGFAVHRERREEPPQHSYLRSRGVAVAAAGGSAGASSTLGTGIGATVSSHLGRTSFTRDGNPPDVLVIGYGTEEALRARGIIGPPGPQAFPGLPTGYERYMAAEATRTTKATPQADHRAIAAYALRYGLNPKAAAAEWRLAGAVNHAKWRAIAASPYSVEEIAEACHGVNRVLQLLNGDPCVSPPWDEEPEEARAFAAAGVEFALSGGTPEGQHEQWRAAREADGWRYGPVRDPGAKTHPSLVGYAGLPERERVKDAVFAAVVRAMAGDGRPTTSLENVMLANIDGLNDLVRDMLQAFPGTADEQEWRDRAGALSVCDPDGRRYRAYTEDDQ